MGQPDRFGPNADDVVAVLEQLDRLSMAEVVSLAAAGRSMTGDTGPGESGAVDPASPRAVVRARLRTLADRQGRLPALKAVGDEIADWAASVAHWFPAGIAGGTEARSEISPRMAALPAILDAAYATVMEDLLTEDEMDLLCAPWDEVVPEPGEVERDADEPGPEAERDADEPGPEADEALPGADVEGAGGVDRDASSTDAAPRPPTAG